VILGASHEQRVPGPETFSLQPPHPPSSSPSSPSLPSQGQHTYQPLDIEVRLSALHVTFCLCSSFETFPCEISRVFPVLWIGIMLMPHQFRIGLFISLPIRIRIQILPKVL
jgi:hypothetical protein